MTAVRQFGFDLRNGLGLFKEAITDEFLDVCERAGLPLCWLPGGWFRGFGRRPLTQARLSRPLG